MSFVLNPSTGKTDWRQTEQYLTGLSLTFRIMEVLKTTSLVLGCPVIAVQQTKKIICYPIIITIQETITGQKLEGIVQTTAG